MVGAYNFHRSMIIEVGNSIVVVSGLVNSVSLKDEALCGMGLMTRALKTPPLTVSVVAGSLIKDTVNWTSDGYFSICSHILGLSVVVFTTMNFYRPSNEFLCIHNYT